MFHLTEDETRELLSRSQNVILKRDKNVKYLPYAFTEHGVVMAANVPKSSRIKQLRTRHQHCHTPSPRSRRAL